MSSIEKPTVNIIAALGQDRVLGRANKLLWHIPEDLKRFKDLTMGHPVIMGRKTFDSIVGYIGKPLSGRDNIVITRDTNWSYPGVHVVHTVKDAIVYAQTLHNDKVFIIGGGQVYAQALPFVDKLYLTLVDTDAEGDTYFPRYEAMFTRTVHTEDREHRGINYRWVDIER